MTDRNDRDATDNKRGLFSRIRDFFFKPSSRYGLGFLLLVGIAVGVAGWNGFMGVVDATSSNQFCSGCHEMEAFMFPDYQKSVHGSNSMGVQAQCKDCHVPDSFIGKMKVKINATLVEVPSHLTGKIATEEKFKAHQLTMAERVWDRMKASDSRECRSCHSYEAMDAEQQSRTARRRHSQEYLEATGSTCIDCHK
ncbi:MAG: NapC/NirT family cytochrome c, partial [Wenzhouxiangella sp.]